MLRKIKDGGFMWKRDEFIISTDRSFLQLGVIHNFISTESYWGFGRSRELVEKAVCNSTYCFGLYCEKNGTRMQVGFARVVTDITTFAYLADVFVLKDYRGKGLGKWLIQTIVHHPDLIALKRITLFTRTPEFYYPIGFEMVDQEKGVSKFMAFRKI